MSLDVNSSNAWVGKLINFAKRTIQLIKIKKQLKPITSISFLEGADYINILSKQKDKIILSVRGSKIYDQNISGFLGIIRKKTLLPQLYNKADSIIVLNHGIKSELKNHFKIECPITVIHNWVEIEQIEKKAQIKIEDMYASLFDGNVIISHGRLAKEKGYEQFLDVYHLVLKKTPDAKFVLIGDGDEKQNLLNKCNTLDLSFWDINSSAKLESNKNVYFLGYQSNPYQFLKKAKVFVFPSLHEGFGNALIEAMACGLPVIASDCPHGPKEILNKKKETRKEGHLLKAEFGLLGPQFHEKNSYEIWSDCIIEILKNKVLHDKYSILAQKRAMNFSSNALLTNWESVILN